MYNCDKFVNPWVATLVPYQPGRPIEALARELGHSDIIKLASNENPLGPSPKALIAAKAALSKVHLYPDSSYHRLIEALSQHNQVDPNQLLVSNGSDEILSLLARGFLNPECAALLSQYAFATFAIVAKAAGGQVISVKEKNYTCDLDAFIPAMTPHTRLIFIANPNNPTGTWFQHKALEQFLAKVPSEVLVIYDEAYHDFVDDPLYPRAIALQRQYPNLVIVRTFSKLYGLAGLRLGYAIAHPSVIGFLQRLRLPFNVNIPALEAGIAALSDTEHCANSLELNRRVKAQLASGLNHLKLDYLDSQTNFLLVNLKREASLVVQAMQAKGVIIRPLLPYQLPEHVRISVGTEAESERCLQTLEEVLSLSI